jgi:glycosyltransferase involved in cell wall biosynthesis
MTRIAIVSSEPIRPRMGGIGVRTIEIVRQLSSRGHDVRLVSPAEAAESRAALPADVEARPFESARLVRDLAGCDCALAQGQLANDLVLCDPGIPIALDFYDPYLIENLHYSETLGLDPYRNDHSSWVLQLARGDFFLCASEEQRLFYLGFLAALGRVNPESLRDDEELRGLVDVVPSGVPPSLPPHERVLEPAPAGRRRLLFGGLYDWYDPWTLLAALEALAEDWELLLVRSPNPDSTPQRLFRAVEEHCLRRGWWGTRVRAIDWIPAERRFDLLAEVDLMVAPHRATLETELALRTRFLDALAAGCPVVASSGGTVSRLLAAHDAGWVVPPGDAAALTAALAEVLAGGDSVERTRQRGRELARRFEWERALEPLFRWVARPRRDASRPRFASRVPTVSPGDSLGFRARRWWRARGRA